MCLLSGSVLRILLAAGCTVSLSAFSHPMTAVTGLAKLAQLMIDAKVTER